MVPPVTMRAAVGWRIWLSFPPSSSRPVVIPPKLSLIPSNGSLVHDGPLLLADGSKLESSSRFASGLDGEISKVKRLRR